MSSNRWRYVLMLALLSPVLALVGCTEADDLAPQTQNLAVDMALVNPDPRYDLVEFQVAAIAARPLDPDADASLTAESINLLRLPVLVSSLEAEATIRLALTNGSYNIEQITFNTIGLRDLQPPTSTTTCIDYVSVWSYTNDVPITPDDLGGIDPVVVENGAANTLSVVVDANAFATAFVESWTCKQYPQCPAGAPWCPGSFNSAAFAARAPEYLTLE